MLCSQPLIHPLDRPHPPPPSIMEMTGSPLTRMISALYALYTHPTPFFHSNDHPYASLSFSLSLSHRRAAIFSLTHYFILP